MITAFDHAGLVIKDIVKQKNFYCNILGLHVLNEKEAAAPPAGDHTGIPGVRRKLISLGGRDGRRLLELVYYIDPPSPAAKVLDPNQLHSMHLCFNVAGLQNSYKDLSAKGVRFLTPPKVIKRPGGESVCLCYAQDPEGNWLEFRELLGKMESA